MEGRIQEIAKVLINGPFGITHNQLLAEAQTFIADQNNLQTVLKIFYSSEQTFVLIAQTLIDKIRNHLYASQIFVIQELLFDQNEDSITPFQQNRLQEIQNQIFKPILSSLLEFSKTTSKKMLNNYIVQLGSLCLRLLLIQKSDHLSFIWFTQQCFLSFMNQFNNIMLNDEKKILTTGLQIFKGFLKEYIIVKKQYFFFKNQVLEELEETYFKQIFIIAIRYFQVFMLMKKNMQIVPEDEVIIFRIVELIDQLIKFRQNCQCQNDIIKQQVIYPTFLNLLWTQENILNDLYSLCEPLISFNILEKSTVPIASLLLKILKIIPQINPPFETDQLKLYYDNKIFNLVKCLCVNSNTQQDSCLFQILHLLCSIIQRRNRPLQQSMLKGLFEYILSFCNKSILNCNLNPEQRSLSLIFRTVRSVELKINKNQCSLSLKLILIFLQRVSKTKLDYESGFEPKEDLDLILIWIKDIISDVSIINYPAIFQFILSTDFQKIHPSSQRLWIVSITLLLFNSKKRKNDISREHIEVAKMYIILLNDLNKIQTLFFIKQMISYLLLQVDSGISTIEMWQKLTISLGGIYFQTFFSQILKKLFYVFMNPCTQIVDYTIEILFETYKKLSKQRQYHDCQNYSTYFNIYKEFVININNSVFNNKDYFSKRKDLMKICCYTQLKQNQKQTLVLAKPIIFYRKFVSANIINNPSIENFQRLMYDASGIIYTLQNPYSITIFIDYVIDDITCLIEKYVIPYSSNPFPSLMKSILHVMSSILKTNCTFTQSLKFKLHKIIKTTLPYYVQQTAYSQKLLKIFNAYIQFNAIEPLILFPPSPQQYRKYNMSESIKVDITKQCDSLIDNYFKQIRRVNNIMILQKYLNKNVQRLFYWSNQMNKRGIQITAFNWEQLVRKNIWRNKIELQLFARVIYRQKVYNNFDHLIKMATQKEDDFVANFRKHYESGDI